MERVCSAVPYLDFGPVTQEPPDTIHGVSATLLAVEMSGQRLQSSADGQSGRVRPSRLDSAHQFSSQPTHLGSYAIDAAASVHARESAAMDSAPQVGVGV